VLEAEIKKMGSIVTLGVDNLEIDWGKNNFSVFYAIHFYKKINIYV